jgi:hypothetical protein
MIVSPGGGGGGTAYDDTAVLADIATIEGRLDSLESVVFAATAGGGGAASWDFSIEADALYDIYIRIIKPAADTAYVSLQAQINEIATANAYIWAGEGGYYKNTTSRSSNAAFIPNTAMVWAYEYGRSSVDVEQLTIRVRLDTAIGVAYVTTAGWDASHTTPDAANQTYATGWKPSVIGTPATISIFQTADNIGEGSKIVVRKVPWTAP